MLKAGIEDLARSGIFPEEAEAAGMYTVKDASKIYPDFKPLPAIIIPYIDPWEGTCVTFKRDSDMLDFCRVRYLGNNVDTTSFKKKKLLRYSQPQSSGVHPYFPAVKDIDWADIANDPDVPIMITEGEKKALAACLAGVPTVGLGGVYNFAQGGAFLPALENIVWEGRTVYICYDSDAATNNSIQVAESRLATEIGLERQANVLLVRLPPALDGAKVGVDDFLLDKGDDALFDMLETAKPMRAMDREILKLNTEVAWVASEGLLLELKTGIWMKKADFTKGSKYSSRVILVPKSKGEGVTPVSVASAFLTHPLAKRYEDTIFRPGSLDRDIQLPGYGGIAYNRFQGLPEVEGDVEPFFDLYDHLMSEMDELDYDLVWKLLAYVCQNMGEKPGLALVLLGRQGSGKTLFGTIITDMTEPYSKVIATKELGEDFNGWMETSIFVLMNESQSRDITFNMEKLNSYITDAKQSVNEKYRARRQVVCPSFFIFNGNDYGMAANFPDDDRRFITLQCPGRHPKGRAFYGPIHEWAKNNGGQKLLNYFRNYDLEGWKPPIQAPATRLKRDIFNANQTALQKTARAILKGRKNIVAQWVEAARDWAASAEVGSRPELLRLADEISRTIIHIPIRPFYTPEELTRLLPAIVSTLSVAKLRDRPMSGALAQEFMQSGLGFLKCEDNFDGFMYKGLIRQYIVIDEREKFKRPISQAEFDDLMRNYLTFAEWEEQNKTKQRKQGRPRRKRRRE